MNPVGPRACYDEGKRFAEAVFTDGCARAGLELRMARIFNTYGPFMHPDDGRVVSNFVVQALRGEDITVYGDGSQTRSFCYADDLIAGFLALMALDGDPSGPVNLGNPVETGWTNWPSWWWNSPARARASCAAPCRWTIHAAAGPISPRRGPF